MAEKNCFTRGQNLAPRESTTSVLSTKKESQCVCVTRCPMVRAGSVIGMGRIGPNRELDRSVNGTTVWPEVWDGHGKMN